MPNRSKSQLNAIYYACRDRLERRRRAGKALYAWVKPGDLSESVAFWLKKAIEGGRAGEFDATPTGFRESRRYINWAAVSAAGQVGLWLSHYCRFERYRAAARAQNSPYYRRRLKELGIDWKLVTRPYGTEGIDLD